MNLLELTQSLLRCPSITPRSAGSLDLLSQHLQKLGFVCERMPKGEVDNLYAKRDRGGKTLCFAGHVDVVPPGPLALWTHPPFDAVHESGILHGRGAVDMKPAICAFIDAVTRVEGVGSIALLLTSDEEGPAREGTRYMVAQLLARGETFDACIVGEPTSRDSVGDTIKIGRRGSLTTHIQVNGIQGHVAYPQEAKNPIPLLLDLLQTLRMHSLDDTAFPGFDPSRLEITTVDVGNLASNVIPVQARATFNIRFTPLHTATSLQKWIQGLVGAVSGASVSFAPAADAFSTPDSEFRAQAVSVVTRCTGHTPLLSTSGGTSDARFLAPHFPVLELGLRHGAAHQVNESVAFWEVEQLRDIYAGILQAFFSAS